MIRSENVAVGPPRKPWWPALRLTPPSGLTGCSAEPTFSKKANSGADFFQTFWLNSLYLPVDN